MKFPFSTLFTIFLTTIGGCAAFGPPSLAVGEPEQSVIAKMGTPTHRYQDGSSHLLEYAHGPFGQTTYLVRMDGGDKLISFEQVLTTQKFASLKIGESTKNDVLHTIGGPTETSYLTLSHLEVWSYPYRENNVWDSMMHVHFDDAGILRKMMNGPDPNRNPDMRFPSGMRRH